MTAALAGVGRRVADNPARCRGSVVHTAYGLLSGFACVRADRRRLREVGATQELRVEVGMGQDVSCVPSRLREEGSGIVRMKLESERLAGPSVPKTRCSKSESPP